MMIVRWWWLPKQTVPGSWGCGKRNHEAVAKNRLCQDKGGGVPFHTIFGKSPTGTLISRSCETIFHEIDSVCLARSDEPFTKGNTKNELSKTSKRLP